MNDVGDSVITRSSDFKSSPGATNRKHPHKFYPTRPAPEGWHNEFKMAGGILGAIGETPLVQLEKIFGDDGVPHNNEKLRDTFFT